MSDKPVKVTVTDPDTGEVLGETILENDYLLMRHGRVYLDGIVRHANGTTILTLKTEKSS